MVKPLRDFIKSKFPYKMLILKGIGCFAKEFLWACMLLTVLGLKSIACKLLANRVLSC
jgi:hypothetical protein